MSTVEERIEDIQKPGHGYGRGCTVVARREGETAGVPWTRITVVNNATGERETVYMTESGWQVDRVTTPRAWAVHGFGVARMSYASNLTKAFEWIYRSREHHNHHAATPLDPDLTWSADHHEEKR